MDKPSIKSLEFASATNKFINGVHFVDYPGAEYIPPYQLYNTLINQSHFGMYSTTAEMLVEIELQNDLSNLLETNETDVFRIFEIGPGLTPMSSYIYSIILEYFSPGKRIEILCVDATSMHRKNADKAANTEEAIKLMEIAMKTGMNLSRINMFYRTINSVYIPEIREGDYFGYISGIDAFCILSDDCIGKHWEDGSVSLILQSSTEFLYQIFCRGSRT